MRNAPLRRVAACAAVVALFAPATAAAAPHPWITGPARVEAPSTYFANLADGQSIETPFVARFGLARFGMAPITKPVPGTGHHHLLVNRELPLDFKQPLPFNEQYIHFGKGQMETVLTFPPGEYRLRLLLADDKHIPHFIYSRPVRIKVAKKNEGVDPKSLVKPGVQIVQPAAGTTVQGAFKVIFHASGLNVGHVALSDAGLGHFRLVAERAGAQPERIALENGASEAWLAPPPGDYKLRVELVRNASPGDVMAASDTIDLRVAR